MPDTNFRKAKGGIKANRPGGGTVTFHTRSEHEAHRRAAIRDNFQKYGQAYKPASARKKRGARKRG